MGWWYTAPLPYGRRVVSLLTDADLGRAARLPDREAWTVCLRRTRHVAALLHEDAQPVGATVASASSGLLNCFGQEGWLATGDAAASCDPLAGQGITSALRSGILASYAAADALSGNGPTGLHRYEAILQAQFAGFRRMHRAHYARESRWQDSRSGKGGVASSRTILLPRKGLPDDTRRNLQNDRWRGWSDAPSLGACGFHRLRVPAKLGCPLCWPVLAGICNVVGLRFSLLDRTITVFTALCVLALLIPVLRQRRMTPHGGLALVSLLVVLIYRLLAMPPWVDTREVWECCSPRCGACLPWPSTLSRGNAHLNCIPEDGGCDDGGHSGRPRTNAAPDFADLSRSIAGEYPCT